MHSLIIDHLVTDFWVEEEDGQKHNSVIDDDGSLALMAFLTLFKSVGVWVSCSRLLSWVSEHTKVFGLDYGLFTSNVLVLFECTFQLSR